MNYESENLRVIEMRRRDKLVVLASYFGGTGPNSKAVGKRKVRGRSALPPPAEFNLRHSNSYCTSFVHIPVNQNLFRLISHSFTLIKLNQVTLIPLKYNLAAGNLKAIHTLNGLYYQYFHTILVINITCC